jgi:hypothetical protein
MASIRSIVLLVMLFLTILPLSYAPGVSATDYEYKESYVLHPDSDMTASAWTANPNNGIYWNKLGSNDTNTTTVFSTAIGQSLKMTFANLNTIHDSAVENGSVRLNVTMWVICRANASGAALQYQIAILTYGYQSMWTNFLSATGVWKNYSLHSTVCTFHQDQWWPYCINYTAVYLTSAGINGKMVVTEVGMLVDVYIPIPYSPGFAINMETIGIIVTLALGFGLMGLGLINKPFMLMSGLVWIFGGIFFLTDLHVGFTILSIGTGAMLLLTTAVEYLGPNTSTRHIQH